MRCGRKKLRHGRKDCAKLNGQTKRSIEDVRKKKSPGSTDRIVNRIRKMQKSDPEQRWKWEQNVKTSKKNWKGQARII